MGGGVPGAAARGCDLTNIIARAPIVYEAADGSTQHAPLIVATVGGLETLLVLDTGSEVHLLTRELVDRVGVTVEPGEEGTDHAGTAVPSWITGDLTALIGGVEITLRGVVVVPAPPPFEGWGIGGILSPQHLYPDAVAVIDLVGDELVLVLGDDEAVAGLVAERAPALTGLSLARADDSPTILVRAAVKPFPPLPTLLNTGGRGTEFAREVVPGLSAGASERIGGGVGGADVLGSHTGPQTLVVEEVEIQVETLALRDEMEPDGMIGMDVLRGTVLACAADPTRRVVWRLAPSPRDR